MEKNMVNAVSNQYGNYDQWIQSLQQRGIKTTSINSAKGEANFQDYVGALSENLKQEIAQSFDCQADYNLQSKLASLLGGKNLMQSTDIGKLLKGTGISYSVSYQKTSYIVDNKADGNYHKTAKQGGSIAVYTFKDANGGEIKIADANGNGALESEELFMNEILSGVVSDISAANGSGKSAANAVNAAGNTAGNDQAAAAQAAAAQAAAAQAALMEQQQALIQQLQEQLKQSEEQLQEMLKQIQTQAANFTATLDTNKDGKVDTEELKADKNEEAQNKLKTDIKEILDNNYPKLSDSRKERVINYVMQRTTTGSEYDIIQILKDLLDEKVEEPAKKKDEE